MNQTSNPEDSENPEEYKCPWCPYTGNLKQVIRHMESGHYQNWYELVLYPPIAGNRY
jgi:hypothetical protein